MAFIDHTYAQYINAYRINFRNWKIVDIDNYMDGNHFFSDLQEERIWNKGVKDLVGGPATVWMEEESKSPLFDRTVMMPMMQQMVEKIEKLDTKSNRKMSPLHKKREEILAKIETKKAEAEAAKAKAESQKKKQKKGKKDE